MSGAIERVVIRHLSGSKANQIEQLPVGDLRELTIGRDPTSKIAFDPVNDGVVSRQHAVIRIEGEGDQLSFKLVDLDSSNGTYLNGQRLSQEAELLPEDTVELGGKGPKFTFDVQPRPANFAARTRVIGVDDSAATRVIETAQTAVSTAVAEASATQTPTPPQKIGVGQETVQRLIGEERRSVSRIWGAAAAGLAAFVILGGGAVYWKQYKDDERRQAEIADVKTETAAQKSAADARTAALPSEMKSQIIGLTPLDIYNKYANATAQIHVRWRLFDSQTGKPIFHQTFSYGGVTLPAYVRLSKSLIVRWLTLEDDLRSNLQIGEASRGTGFVVGEQGYLLTNKHVAAGWKVTYDSDETRGFLFEVGGGPNAKDPKLRKPAVVDLNQRDLSDLNSWVPESGGFIFPSRVAVPIGNYNIPDPSQNEQRSFEGRNELLEVRFPGSRLGVNASLLRSSPDSDAALVKIDSPQTLDKVDLAQDDAVTIGEKVVVLGYPAVSVENRQRQMTEERGQVRTHSETIPEATVTDGIVSKVSSGFKQKDGVTLYSDIGETIQLSVLATGAGNSGGPVFNSAGKVIGLFTYSKRRGDTRVTLAVPIKFGRDLLRAQRN